MESEAKPAATLKHRASSSELAVLQPVIPDYRVPLFNALFEQFGSQIQFFAGETNENGTLGTKTDAIGGLNKLTNRYIYGGNFLIQLGFEKALREVPLLILNSSLRNVTTLKLLYERRRRYTTVLWGHIEGRHRLMRAARERLIAAGEGFIAYTDREADRARRIRKDDRVWSVRNSCVWKRDCVPAGTDDTNRCNILFVGRLISDKQPLRLLRGFALAVDEECLPRSSRLIFVGDGPMKRVLASEAFRLGIPHRVEFTGHISDMGALRQLYGEALFAASPGYVGLSAIQSFAMGVPMLISRDEPHSPEIEACESDVNSLFVELRTAHAWADKIKEMFQRQDVWQLRRISIAERISETYTYDHMIETFLDVFRSFGVIPVRSGRI